MAHFEYGHGREPYIELRAKEGEHISVEMAQAWALLNISNRLEDIRHELEEARLSDK